MTPSFLTQPVRLLLFGGKGGVGKTTCATATAFSLAKANPTRRYVLVSTDPAHSVNDAIAGATPPENLQVVELDAAAKHREFMAQHEDRLREIAKLGTFLDGEDIDRFLKLSVPGLDELMAFLQLADWLDESRYDTIIADTAPTGHTLRLLAMPDFLSNWLGVLDALLAKHRFMKETFGGPSLGDDDLTLFLQALAARFDTLAELLADHQQCRFVPVMLAERLSVLETMDLLEQLGSMQIRADEIIVNRVIPPDADATLSAWRTRQSAMLAALPKAITVRTLWGAPLLGDEVEGADRLARFFDHFIPPAQLASFMKGTDAAPPAAADAPTRTLGHADLAALAKLRIMFFAGKGGTGKTTLSAAAALALADQTDRRVLIVSTDPAHSLADALGATLGPEATAVASRLEAIELDAGAEFEAFRDAYSEELEEFLDGLLQSIDLAYDRDVMERLLDLAPPGLDEVMALLRVVDTLRREEHDIVILDTAPTGHLLRLLELPELIDHWLQAVFAVFLKYERTFRLPKFQARLIEISRGIKSLRALLTGPQAAVIPVSILTDLALAESKDLVEACDRLKVRVPLVLLNQALPPGRGILADAVRLREATVRQAFADHLRRTPQVLVYRVGEPRGVEELTSLGLALFGCARAAA